VSARRLDEGADPGPLIPHYASGRRGAGVLPVVHRSAALRDTASADDSVGAPAPKRPACGDSVLGGATPATGVDLDPLSDPTLGGAALREADRRWLRRLAGGSEECP
jgi:hypothetical protein